MQPSRPDAPKPAVPVQRPERQPTPTRPLSVLVADGNGITRADLSFLLNVNDRVGEVITLADGADVLQALHDHAVDVVFINVKLPNADGFDIARMLRRYPDAPPLVFVTDSERHAVEAFGVNALDYLIRPIRDDRLSDTLGRVAELRRSRPTQVLTTPGADESIPVELGGVTRFIKRSDVRYVEAHGDYARLVTSTGRHLIRVPLAVLEERWAEAGFVRIHRRYLVALACIEEVRVDQGKASVIVGDARLEISRRHTRELRDRLVRHARPGR